MSSEKEVVFVTSFRPDMYEATGKHLLRSFLDYCPDAHMLVCIEDFGGVRLEEEGPSIERYDVSQDELLTTWLAHNEGIIPRSLGGSAGGCDCFVTGFGIEEQHRPGCPNGWYNRNASRWFRKLVALKAAVRTRPPCALIWIDSDCRFKIDLSTRTIMSWFRETSGFYFKSPARQVMESGLFGIDTKLQGKEFLDAVLDRYTSGAFRNDSRWDDGYQLQAVVNERTDIKMVDLSPGALQWQAEVIEPSSVGRYITHYRGVHGPVLRIMT